MSGKLAGVERLIAAAQKHGAESDPNHEVGDLQDALRACWAHLSARGRAHVFEECAHVLEWLPASE